jgi:hypothetical protein
MTLPKKPCYGKLSDATLELLRANKNREQWATHRCEVCGIDVTAKPEKGNWIAERHWPSVAYAPRKTGKQSARFSLSRAAGASVLT